MKTSSIVTTVIVSLFLSPGTLLSEEMKSDKDKASYAIGMQLGKQLSRDKDELDIQQVINGMQDTFTDAKPKLSEDEMQQALSYYRDVLRAKQAEAFMKASEENQKAGKAFLASNAKNKGITTLDSGVQYKVLKSGKGKSPKATDTVVTHYEGRLISGKVFDSSYKRGQPATFPVNGVIKGWTEILQKMKAGDKWQVFIPSELAYGQQGAGADIGPNEVLVFDIELLEIK